MFMVVANRDEQVGDVSVMEAIERVAARTSDGDQATLPEQPELMRGGAG